MCRTLLKPGIPYAKANWRQAKPHISMRTNKVMPSSEWTICAPGMLCMTISLAASSSPQSGVLLCSLFVFAFHCYRASTNILLYEPSEALHYVFWAQPSSIYQRRPCSTQGPPSSARYPQPPLWHDAVVAFRAFMLAVVWGRLKTHCVRQPLSWVVGREPAGLRVERQECAYEWANVCRAPADRGTVCLSESCSSTILFNYTCCSGTDL